MSWIRISIPIVLVTAMAGCGSSSPAPAPTPNPPAPVTVTIPVGASTLGRGGFIPNPITVAVGGTVTWNNTDTATSSHNVTSDSGVFASQNFANGATFSFTFQSRGTFNYTCTRHAGMAGTVTVQ